MVEVSDDEALVVEEVGASTLWYQRLRHMSEKRNEDACLQRKNSRSEECKSRFL